MKKRIFFGYILFAMLISMQVFAGTNIVKKDGTIYESPVDNDPSDSDFVRAVDTKYNIKFESKREFKTNKGDFFLNYAKFDYNDLNKYSLILDSGVLKEKAIKVYLLALNPTGTIVDYNYRTFSAYEDDLSMKNNGITLNIDDGNPLNISMITFSITNPGLDPKVAAHKFEDKMISDNIGINKKYPDVYSYFYGPDSDWADHPDSRDEHYARYLKQLEESIENNRVWLEQYPDVYEIQ